MRKIAFVFSGQGAQYSGMGSGLYSVSPAASAVFDAAEAIRPGTTKQCFTADKEELSLTVNTQPCIFTVSTAAAAALLERGVVPSAAAGFSVGETAALTFAGVFGFSAGFNAIIKRAQLMNAAAQKNPGGMAAVLRLPQEKTAALCKAAGVTEANFNCPGQTVVAGGKKEMAEFIAAVNSEGGRAMPLSVSGAFHSPLMAEAADSFGLYLNGIASGQPRIPVYSNINGLPFDGSLKKKAAAQIKNPVLWQASVENMIKDGVDIFIETGPGRVLCGLIAKIDPAVTVLCAEDKESLENAIGFLRGESLC